MIEAQEGGDALLATRRYSTMPPMVRTPRGRQDPPGRGRGRYRSNRILERVLYSPACARGGHAHPRVTACFWLTPAGAMGLD